MSSLFFPRSSDFISRNNSPFSILFLILSGGCPDSYTLSGGCPDSYTSVQQRILHPEDHSLRPFSSNFDEEAGLPFGWKDYLELVDWAGREIKPGKRGSIPTNTPPVLTRLGMDAAPVLDYLSRIEKQPFRALGPVSLLRAFAHSVGQRFVKGLAVGRRLCPEPTI